MLSFKYKRVVWLHVENCKWMCLPWAPIQCQFAMATGVEHWFVRLASVFNTIVNMSTLDTVSILLGHPKFMTRQCCIGTIHLELKELEMQEIICYLWKKDCWYLHRQWGRIVEDIKRAVDVEVTLVETPVIPEILPPLKWNWHNDLVRHSDMMKPNPMGYIDKESGDSLRTWQVMSRTPFPVKDAVSEVIG